MTYWPTCSPHTKMEKQHECVIDLYANDIYQMTKLQTVVEMPEFQRRAKTVMSDDEREAVIVWTAENPEAGTSLGGGLRKVRIPRDAGGKRGGFRMIYVFGGRHMPIFLITVFAKNEKANLTPKEQAAAVELSKEIVGMWSDKE
ncbi:type II toxin-antitoxin system RelE/ParE family toxin [Ruegeria sp.]|uniref:type II toxin-antitoxin system RelE/ParE family toxin n=1 Tax=Ruegeria sp. TaxID=1879320 RepID=UPI003B003C59